MSVCEGQCGCRALGFGSENPFKFAAPLLKWPLHPVSFIVYRWILAIYQLVVFIVNLVFWGSELNSEHSIRPKFLIFVSNWSFIVLTLYTTWSAIAATYWHLRGKKGVTVGTANGNDIAMANSNATEADMIESGTKTPRALQTPWYFKVNWFLQVIACDAEFAVTLLYWVLEYDGEPIDFFTINVHGVGFALLLLDFFLVASPWRVLHVVWSSLYAALYFLFTYIYFAAGGLNTVGFTAIYSGNLDWGEDVVRSLVVSLIAVFVGTPAIHLIYSLLYLLKHAFTKCCTCCEPRTRA